MSTKGRNKVLFLACLFAFVGIGVALYRQWSDRKPFAVIVFVADGLTPSNLSAARLFAGGSEFRFGMETMPHMSLASPRSKDYAVADAAAAATSVATGQEVNRGSLAMSPGGQPLETILQTARREGRATGLVSDAPLTDAAAAAFFARASDARDPSSIALQLLEEGMPDVMLGGGASQLTPQEQGGARRDGRDLLLEMRQRGFDIARTKAELESTPGWRAPQLFGVFAGGDLATAEEQAKYPSQPRLADLVQKAVELLQFNARGYLLVVHVGSTGRALHQSEAETFFRQMRELDEAVQTARQYAGDNTLLVVAGLGNPGGLRLNAFSFAPDRGIAVLGPSPAGLPAISWSTGGAPGAEGAPLQAASSATSQPEQAAEDVLVLASGPGSENLTGFLPLAGLHKILAGSL
ncbi:MAG: alkaline phosphatase [Chthoniobacterales bacterium]|nr:alkaline phosphatase [Chthoniobacterales bacterium]